MRRLPLAVAVSLALGLAGLLTVLAQEKKGVNYAFLVACSRYQFGLPELPFTVKEIKEFRTVLLKTGFDRDTVILLADGGDARYLPEKDKILTELDFLLAGVGANDTVVVVLNGHGVHFKGDKVSYFCTPNSKVADRQTLLPLDGPRGLFEQLRVCKTRRKLLLVNACRNDPELERSMAANKVELDKDTEEEVPEGIAALFSCKPSQKSYYYDPKNPKTAGQERSLFFHHLIETWQGSYADEGKSVTLEDVFREVQVKTAADARILFGEKQVPDPRREYKGEWVVNTSPSPDRGKTEVIKGEITNKLDMKLVLIRAAGKIFRMGSPKGEKGRFDHEEPHNVTLTKDFYLGKYPVTRGQFARYLRETGKKSEAEEDAQGGYGINQDTDQLEGRKPQYTWKNTGFAQTDDHPVVNVTWNDADAFRSWLSQKEGIQYRLPTEAEWEFACRAGTTTRYFTGDEENSLKGYANVRDQALKATKYGKNTPNIYFDFEDGYAFTSPVGSFKPNPFGLCDMTGNVRQWCADWYAKYDLDNSTDPKGPPTGTSRILRGGSWGNYPGFCRTASRLRDVPSDRHCDFGFRVACWPGP